MTDRDFEWLAMYVAGADAADKMRADIQARWERRHHDLHVIGGWSHYDREALRSGHVGYDRENYGL